VKKNPALTRDQKEDDYCLVCYTSGLGDSPSLMPECGHLCHEDCLMNRIKKRWSGPRITFSFCECPACRKWASVPNHPEITKEMKLITTLYEEIKKKALERIKFEGLDKDKRLHDPADKFYNKPEEYAMTRLCYYMCFKCKKPYFGGLKNCENVNEGAKEFKEEDLVCGACIPTSSAGGIMDCAKHGKEFIEFKCRFCCSVAQWFCWGSTHFCEPCHARQCKGEYVSKIPKDKLPKCLGPGKCPLLIKHPPNGDEYSLGCAVCRNMQANVKPF
jgi:E3 ubiquitin-protein ligase MYCBP2